MKKIMRLPAGLLVLLALAALFPGPTAGQTQSVTVGRVFYIEGELLRYVPEDRDWVAVVQDAPFGTEDTLYSGARGMAELLVPNGTWMRIGNNTQIQAIALERGLSEIDMASGVARFYNKGAETLLKATSPFGYVLAAPDTAFDFYVGENSVEVVPVKGTVTFVRVGTNVKYDLSAGDPSILADEDQVASGEGTVDVEWDEWNRDRESYWAAKSRVSSRSAQYLPADLRDEGYVLEETGRWESVYYEGAYRWFWRPTIVNAGWAPFTVGRWTAWYGDQTWIPAEPFGYVTHHYGNWIYARNYWYWAPPVARVTVGLPLLNLGFFWNPGRVSWIHRGGYVGWVPLAPREPYYCQRPWGGPRTVVVTNVNIGRININIGGLAYRNRAVLVDQNNFYRVNSYRNVRVTNISNTTIINNYRAAPVLDDKVITNYRQMKQRHDFADVPVTQKPHNAVVGRIQQNQSSIRKAAAEIPSVVQKQVKGLPEGRIDRRARVAEPRAPNYLVPSDQVNRPKSEIRLPERELKGPPERVAPEKIERPVAPAGRPQEGRLERITPAGPERALPERREGLVPVKPDGAVPIRPERIVPGKPGAGEKPQGMTPIRPERLAPEKLERIEKSVPLPLRPQEAKPEKQAPVGSERIVPGKVAPPAPEKVLPAKPERAAPDKLERIEKPTTVPGTRPGEARPDTLAPAKSERVAPEKPAPARLEKLAPAKPERVTPDKLERMEKPPTPTVRPEEPKLEKAAPPKTERVVPEKIIPPKPETVAPQKPAERAAPEKLERIEKPAPARPEKVAPAKPERVTPDKLERMEKPPTPTVRPEEPKLEKAAPPKTERVVPEKIIPPKPETVAPQKPAERAAPEKLERIEKPAPPPVRLQEVKPEKVVPVRPERVVPDKAAPPKPEKVVPVKPERVVPEKLERIEKPAAPVARPQETKPEKVAPPRPERVVPEKVAPEKSEHVEKPATSEGRSEEVKPEGIAPGKPERGAPGKQGEEGARGERGRRN